MKVPPKIRPIKKKDRPRLESILKALKHFQPAEVQVALELIDIALTQRGQEDYIFRIAYQIPRAFYGKRGYKEQARILDYYAVGDHKLIFSKTPTPISPPRLGPRWKEY